MLTIVATAKNLEDLIETKPTQRGRLLTKFIGLEIIEKKEDINKTLMSEFKSKMKSNLYNTKQLEIDNVEFNRIIGESRIEIKESQNSLTKTLDKIKEAVTKKEELLGKRYIIDADIIKVNPDTLKIELEKLTNTGTLLNKKLDEITESIK